MKWIKDKAFYKCSGLSYLNLPESLITIGTSAFEDSSVDSVYIPNSILEIRKKAFSGCDIPVVISAIENPFEISTDVFSKNTYYNATLYVPVGTMELYKNTKGWNSFNYIVERISSGIKDFTVDNKTSKYIYDINGRKLKNPQKGINIIGGKKILIK